VTYRLTNAARLDLLDIWNYIAENSEKAADRFIDLFVRHFELLGENPLIGRKREDCSDRS